MSMWEMMIGVDPMAGIILNTLFYRDHEIIKSIPRLRDAYVDPSGHDGKPTVVVFTRTGGGNRNTYIGETQFLRDNADFIKEVDWEMDETYAMFHFHVPKDLEEGVEILMRRHNDPNEDYRLFTPTEKFNSVLKELNKATAVQG